MNPRGKRYLSYLAVIRPEEYLTILFFVVFYILDRMGITRLRLDTNFIKASVSLFSVFTVIYLIITVIRRLLGKRYEKPLVEKGIIGTAIAIPLFIFVLVAARVIPHSAFSVVINAGWGLLGIAIVAGVFLVLKRSKDHPDVSPMKLLWGMLSDALNFVRDWSPFIILLAMYENTLYLVARVNHRLFDPYMFHLDKLIFGGHLDLWLQQFIRPGLTEWMSFNYDALYFYPVVIGMILYFMRRKRHFRNFMMAFIIAGWLGFIGYLIFPVIGPGNYYQNVYTVDLGATNGAQVIAAQHSLDKDKDMTFLRIARMINDKQSYAGYIPRNCFPSMHTAWAVISMIYSFLYLPLLFVFILIPLLSLILATIYLRFHYMVDVLAGTLLAVLTVTIIPRFDLWWQRHQPEHLPGRLPPPAPLPRTATGRVYPWTRAILWLRQAWDRMGRYMTIAGVVIPLAFFTVIGVYVYTGNLRQADKRARATILAQYRSRTRPNLPGDAQINAILGHKIKLLGRVVDNPPHAGSSFKLTLFWQKIAPVSGHWKVFVHVDCTGGLPRINVDHDPVFGLYPISEWQSGEVIRDCVIITIPKDYAGHGMKVWVGLFNQDYPMQRMPIENPKQVPNDGHNRILVLSVGKL